MKAAEPAALASWNALLDRARERVSLYRERLPAEPLTSLDQVADLPFTTKDDLREHYPLGLLAVPLDRVVRVHASSGTTGRPVVTAYTRADLDGWAECMARVLRAGEVTERDVMQNAYGYGLFTGGLGFHLGAERLGCAIVPTSSGVTQRQVMLLRPARRPMRWSWRRPSPRRASATGCGCAPASSAPSPGPRGCGARSRPGSAWRRSTSTA